MAEDAFADTPMSKALIVPEEKADEYIEYAKTYQFSTINGKDVYPLPEGITIEGNVLTKVSGMVSIDKLELPPYVTVIKINAFNNRPRIKEIIGTGVVEIQEKGMYGARQTTTAIFPKLKKIGRSGLESCGALVKFEAPLLEEIGVGAFKSVSKLREINFPLLKEVPVDGFNARWDGQLTTVILPSVTKIDDNGSEKAKSIPIASKGGIRADNAAGDYRVLTDNDGRNFLFSLKESKVVATFWTSPSIGRGSYYNTKEGYLYFTTATGSDAKMRSLYRIPLKLDNFSEQFPEAELYFRIGSRTEYDSRQGYFLTIGADPYTRKLYLSWLDQGRTGPAVENRTKMYQLPMLGKEETLPVKSLALYHLHHTYNISSIYHYRQLP